MLFLTVSVSRTGEPVWQQLVVWQVERIFIRPVSFQSVDALMSWIVLGNQLASRFLDGEPWRVLGWY